MNFESRPKFQPQCLDQFDWIDISHTNILNYHRIFSGEPNHQCTSQDAKVLPRVYFGVLGCERQLVSSRLPMRKRRIPTSIRYVFELVISQSPSRPITCVEPRDPSPYRPRRRSRQS